ncbi:hypothetical protein [Vogesella indigofera]|uniref:hypothetical protein n=1 Tax=Vogesella indigofera TaxID=45465 RepID=UPI001473696D|nr:hypothetical protein [Vogesella indigofera]
MRDGKDLAARDAKRDLGAELLASVKAMKANEAARVTEVAPTLAAEARTKTEL